MATIAQKEKARLEAEARATPTNTKSMSKELRNRGTPQDMGRSQYSDSFKAILTNSKPTVSLTKSGTNRVEPDTISTQRNKTIIGKVEPLTSPSIDRELRNRGTISPTIKPKVLSPVKSKPKVSTTSKANTKTTPKKTSNSNLASWAKAEVLRNKEVDLRNKNAAAKADEARKAASKPKPKSSKNPFLDYE